MSIRDSFRTKEEIFESDFVTLGELSLFKSFEDLYKQQDEEREKREKEYKYYCHVCDTPMKYNILCSQCGNNICPKHTLADLYKEIATDNKYCPSCWEIGTKYREQIIKLDKEIKEIKKKWNKELAEKIRREKEKK